MVRVALLILMLLTGQHNADSIATDDVKFLKPFDFDVEIFEDARPISHMFKFASYFTISYQ
jgi:hypothetical protein